MFSRNIDLLLFVVLVAFSVRVLACLLAWPNLDGREQKFASKTHQQTQIIVRREFQHRTASIGFKTSTQSIFKDNSIFNSMVPAKG